MAAVVDDLTGLVCGFLTVLREQPHPRGFGKNARWLCRCRCGTETIAVARANRRPPTARGYYIMAVKTQRNPDAEPELMDASYGA